MFNRDSVQGGAARAESSALSSSTISQAGKMPIYPEFRTIHVKKNAAYMTLENLKALLKYFCIWTGWKFLLDIQ